MLVPPILAHPPLAHEQKMARPVRGSASAATSGTSRHDDVPAPELVGHGCAPVKASRALVAVLWTPGPRCHAGMVHVVEFPPPPVPLNRPRFHTDSLGGGPSPLIVVPPTPVTHGWPAGSSTSRRVSLELGKMKQSSDPSSPAAATTVWPWATACWKIDASAWM